MSVCKVLHLYLHIFFQEGQHSFQNSNAVVDTENAASTQSQLSESNIHEVEPPQTLEQQHTEETSVTNMPTQEPARKKRRNNPKGQTQTQIDSADSMLAEALDCLQRSSNDINDPYFSFGKYIANELRKYDPHTLACVKNAINKIIFDADLGNYTQQQFTPQYSTQQYLHSSTSSSHTITPSPAVTPPPATLDSEVEDITHL